MIIMLYIAGSFFYDHLIATFDIEIECGIKIRADSSDFFKGTNAMNCSG